VALCPLEEHDQARSAQIAPFNKERVFAFTSQQVPRLYSNALSGLEHVADAAQGLAGSFFVLD